MAFVTLEDRYGEIECLVFPSQYEKYSYMLRLDNAIFVKGNLSVRDDEAVKIILSGADELIENSKYEEVSQKVSQTPTKQEASQQVSKQIDVRPKRISKIYLRVPDLECIEYQKAKNLVDIFFGSTRVIFYDSSNSAYSDYPSGIDASEYIVNELKQLLGNDNVVAK